MHKNRPLSPHLTIYKPQMTSILSICHRISGAALAVLLCLSVFFYNFTTSHILNYDFYTFLVYLNTEFNNPVIFFLVPVTFSLYYHICNGIRHLFWDFSLGLKIKTIYRSGYAIIIISLLMSLYTWEIFI